MKILKSRNMNTQRTKGSWNEWLKKFKITFTGFPSNSIAYTEDREGERLKKMIQQREVFIKWANTL